MANVVAYECLVVREVEREDEELFLVSRKFGTVCEGVYECVKRESVRVEMK